MKVAVRRLVSKSKNCNNQCKGYFSVLQWCSRALAASDTDMPAIGARSNYIPQHMSSWYCSGALGHMPVTVLFSSKRTMLLCSSGGKSACTCICGISTSVCAIVRCEIMIMYTRGLPVCFSKHSGLLVWCFIRSSGPRSLKPPLPQDPMAWDPIAWEPMAWDPIA